VDSFAAKYNSKKGKSIIYINFELKRSIVFLDGMCVHFCHTIKL
jgi:hypothetical protein